MTTNEEFQAAIEMINSCIATLNCGCKYDEFSADVLYFKCKNYLEAYKRRENEDIKSRT